MGTLECGQKVYNEQLRATLNTEENKGNLLAIEVESGDYQLMKEVN